MKTSWFIGIVMMFVLMTIVASVCEMSYLPADGFTKLDILMKPSIVSDGSTIGGFTSLFSVPTAWLGALWDMFWFDYPFFEGAWVIFRYIFFLPISIGIIVSLVLAIVRGVGSG